MTEGPVGRMLFRLTLPMTFGIYSFMAFNFVDAVYIGRLGTLQLAAISFTFPVALVVGSLGQGLGIGASAVISRAIGEGDESNVRRLTTDTLILAFLGALLFASLGLVTIDPLFRLLGAGDDVLPFIRQYMVLWYIGVPFVIIPMVGNNAIRATGDTRTPAMIMIMSAVANAVLDPFFIFGIWIFPDMGITGAALASLIARAASLFIGLWVISHRERLLTLARPPLDIVVASWRQILYIGLPAAGANALTPLSLASSPAWSPSTVRRRWRRSALGAASPGWPWASSWLSARCSPRSSGRISAPARPTAPAPPSCTPSGSP